MGVKILASTVVVIALLGILVMMPLFVYMHIMIRFFANRNLQNELKGGKKRQLTRQSLAAPRGATTVNGRRKRNVPPVLLSCVDLTYTVIKTKQQILDGVSCWFAPGTLTAVLGTSGKSSKCFGDAHELITS